MKFFDKKFGIFDIVLLCLLLGIFYFMTFRIGTDIPLHAQFIKDYAYGNKPFQTNFLYYGVVYLLSFFSSKTSSLLTISAYVLTAATYVKFVLGRNFLSSGSSGAVELSAKKANLLSAALLFCFSLPTIMAASGYFYLLSFPPNVWHNSTTIFAMPFVMGLFWISVRQLENPTNKRMLWIGLLIVANVVVKPSFLFVYLLVYPLLLLKTYRFSKTFWVNLLPLFLAGILILVEYYFIYVSVAQTEKNSVVIEPFSFMKVWSAGNNLALVFVCTFICSFLFPIVTLAKNPKMLKEKMVQFALLGIAIALLIGNLFTEVGTRASDGNFLWQNIMCSFLLFMTCIYQIVKSVIADERGFKAFIIELLALSLHVLATLVYFIKIIKTDSYF
ncbi:hypothetical protein [Flavobacterium sp.]|uniref:hypothetical protein n=1 Tax=Flavobacterium sp. TaxID=239 RepID=UPI0012188C66|nr:hypothetical protein [Flavobacterium sp.]RZJ71965.1 MAG: hypothetical protein EOO49_08010 [Flavobacterium sp.]